MSQAKRKYYPAKLLNKLKHPLELNMLWLFSSENNFYQNQKNYWVALSTQYVPILMKNNHSVYIFGFGVVTRDGDMPPFIVPHSFRLYKGQHQVLDEVVLLWIKTVAARRLYIRQQDSALCHTSRRTQPWQSENFCNHISRNVWLHNSPDCNPLHDVWDTGQQRNKQNFMQHQIGTESKDKKQN